MVGGALAAGRYLSFQIRLHVARLVDRAAHEKSLTTVPVPDMPEAGGALGEDGLLKLSRRPVASAVRAHLHPRDASPAAPREASDLPPTPLGKYVGIGRKGDGRLGVHHEAELPCRAVVEWVRVLGGLVARHGRAVGKLEAADPFDLGVALPSGKEQPRGITLGRTDRLPVLAIGDHGVVQGLLERNAAGHDGRVPTLGQHPTRPPADPDLTQQCGQRHPSPLTRAEKAVDLAGGAFWIGVSVISCAAVSGALYETEPRLGGKSLQVIEREGHRSIHHPVDQELVTVGVDGWDPGMVPLEVEIRRSDDAREFFDRGPGRGRHGWIAHAPPGLLSRCPLAQHTRGRPHHLGGIRLCRLRACGFLCHRERVGLGLQQAPGDQPSRGSQHRASRDAAHRSTP